MEGWRRMGDRGRKTGYREEKEELKNWDPEPDTEAEKKVKSPRAKGPRRKKLKNREWELARERWRKAKS